MRSSNLATMMLESSSCPGLPRSIRKVGIRHRRIAALAHHALFDWFNNLYGRRDVLHYVNHLIGGLQEDIPY